MAVTGSDSPPNDSKRAAERSRAASPRAPEVPEAKLRMPSPVPQKSSSTAQPEPEGHARTAVNRVLAARQTRAAEASGKADPSATPARSTNGAGSSAPPAERLAADQVMERLARELGASVASASRSSEANVSRPGEAGRNEPSPDADAPVLVARQPNNKAGVAAPPIDSKGSKRITPRSPRTALEPDTVEMPTRRSKSVRHPFVIVGNAIISIFVLIAIAGAVALVIGKQRFEAPGPLSEDRVVNIPRGSGIRDIADVLMRDGVIDQPWVFVGGVVALKAREDLKAGEYQFKAHASLRDVIETIIEGRVVAHQFTVPEGLTSEQIVARLLDDDVLAGNIKEIPREGSLLPDTYNFARGVTREQVIQRMQQAQQRVLKEIWDRHSPDLPIKTPEQLVILASMIEKETGKPEERTRIAAVFVNRLKQKMRLQSDPTIIYGLVGGKGTLGRPIMKSEIEQPTPYNTYQIDGLPPGPIDNPGRAALEAAANPARTRELYFVADGTGGHAFAESYEQHQRNVARLRAMESADQKDQAPAAAQSVSAPAGPSAAASPPPQSRRAASRHNQQAPPAAAPAETSQAAH